MAPAAARRGSCGSVPQATDAGWRVVRARTAPVTLCLPARFATTDVPDLWVAAGTPGTLQSNVQVWLARGPELPTLAPGEEPIRTVTAQGDTLEVGCSDCQTSRAFRQWSEVLAGRRRTIETALVSGGIDHRTDVPTALLRAETDAGTRVAVMAEDPAALDFAELVAIVRSARLDR